MELHRRARATTLQCASSGDTKQPSAPGLCTSFEASCVNPVPSSLLVVVAARRRRDGTRAGIDISHETEYQGIRRRYHSAHSCRKMRVWSSPQRGCSSKCCGVRQALALPSHSLLWPSCGPCFFGRLGPSAMGFLRKAAREQSSETIACEAGRHMHCLSAGLHSRGCTGRLGQQYSAAGSLVAALVSDS